VSEPITEAQRALENYRTPERRDVLFGATPASPTQALLPGLILAGAKQTPALRVSVRQGFSDEFFGMVLSVRTFRHVFCHRDGSFR
jgi:DNA-binding transcriptional LysR family regulator